MAIEKGVSTVGGGEKGLHGVDVGFKFGFKPRLDVF